MTVRQLKEELSKYPDDMDVYMAERKTEFIFGLVNSARKEEINFSEEPYEEAIGKDTVVILDEE